MKSLRKDKLKCKKLNIDYLTWFIFGCLRYVWYINNACLWQTTYVLAVRIILERWFTEKFYRLFFLTENIDKKY